jgi:hypothetical protein
MDASSRMAVGANFMIVSRSGSNNFGGSFETNLQPKSLNDTNIPGGSPADQTIHQYTPTFGGPVLRDKLWYFGSYRYLSQEFGIARKAEDIERLRLFDPDFEPYNRHLPTHQVMVKGTWQISPRDQLTPMYQYNRTLLQNNGNDPTWTEDRALGQYSGGPLYALTYNRTFGNWGMMSAQGGGYSKPFEVQPQGAGPNVIYYNATILNAGRPTASGPALANTGNVQSVNRSEQRRANVNADFTVYVPKMAGTHEFKTGVNATPLHEYTFVNTSSNDGYILEERVLITTGNPAGGSRPFHRRYESPVQLEGVGKGATSYGLYLQDTWRPTRRLVLNLGLRMDKSQTYDTWGDPIQSSWQGGPRLGATYRLTEGGDILKASWNRMYDSTNLLFAFSEGSLRKGTRDEWDANGDGVFEIELVAPPVLTRPLPAANANRGIVDPDLKQPRTDEFTAGYSKQLPWNLIADINFVLRQYQDKMVGFDTNGIYENGQFLGYRDPTYNQIIMVTNSSENWLTYKSLDFALSKNLAHNVQFLAGYSFANLTQDGTWDLNDPASFLQPDSFEGNSKGVGRTVNPASSQANSYQTASYVNTGTPPHNFKLNATYIAPWNITMGLSYVYQMGQWSGPVYTLIPQSQVTHPSTVTLSNGRVVANPLATRTRFYYPTRDEGQTTAPALSELNLRVGKRFRWQDYTFEAAVQGFNIFNRGDDLFFNAPTLVEGQPSTFTRRLTQAPRAGQITLKFSF